MAISNRIFWIAKACAATVALAASLSAVAAPVLNTNDFIASPAFFNGFESIPNDGTYYTGGAGPYSEGGIQVTQVNGDAPNDIWVAINSSPSYAIEGDFAWYPNGGDNGYTRIRLASGIDMDGISLLFRSYASGGISYELLDDGTSILTGDLTASWGNLQRIGFSGGNFDELLLRGGDFGTGIADGRHQALHIDAIKVGSASAIPEPASLFLLGVALAGMAGIRRRRQEM